MKQPKLHTSLILLTLLGVASMVFSAEKRKYDVRLGFVPPTDATTVTLTGDFCKWETNAIPMEKQQDGSYSVKVSLPEGIYLYKFVVDGGKRWFEDPKNPHYVPDGFGGRNSILIVGNAKYDPVKFMTPQQKTGEPVTFSVEGLPPKFHQKWIPVKFYGGKLVYGDTVPDPSRGQLLLSKRRFWYPPDVPETSATIASRPLFVYLPPGYAKAGLRRRYPVVYLHDGQNVWDDDSCCFGHGGWRLNRLLEENTTIPRAILVGIPNSSARRAEYGIGDDILALQPSPYLRFLVEVVKPTIDREFRTRPPREYTSLMGSSMGGMISIYGGYAYPDVFGNVAALSTSFWIPDAKGHTLLDVVRQHGRGKFRLYIDSGTAGIQDDGVVETREFAVLARQKAWTEGGEFEHFEDVGAAHNEAAWRKRAWRPLMFILRPAEKEMTKKKN
ncbi:MAG: alpha/beta hydrolase-fold protein [Candidatus Sumerlaeaceae bacterium]